MGTSFEDKNFKRIIKKFLTKRDNILLSQEIFIAKRVVEWILSTTKDPKVIDSFMLDLERHLSGIKHLAWIEEIISKNESETHDNQKSKKAIKSTNAK